MKTHSERQTTMQIKIFMMPLSDIERSEAEANKFLRSHRILQTDRQFCPDGGGYWTLLAQYLDGDPAAEVPPAHRREQTDPTVGLSEAEREKYERLKAIRREVAKRDAVAAYMVFTNHELAMLAQLPVLDEETTRKVKGIAPRRLSDYARYFYDKEDAEASKQPDAEDSSEGEPA